MSKANRTEKAIEQFTIIIKHEKEKEVPTETLMIAVRTRIINLKRLKKYSEAQRDLDFANEVIRKFPHLKDQAWHFRELEDTDVIDNSK